VRGIILPQVRTLSQLTKNTLLFEDLIDNFERFLIPEKYRHKMIEFFHLLGKTSPFYSLGPAKPDPR
jgi:hypothetical protein